ncbi:MAG: cobalamin biosynthesis protein CobT [Microbacterium sp.]|jgi:hypothetical protein|nr:cobalamin biosynthesis protein CobT [Microbacterium sp.]
MTRTIARARKGARATVHPVVDRPRANLRAGSVPRDVRVIALSAATMMGVRPVPGRGVRRARAIDLFAGKVRIRAAPRAMAIGPLVATAMRVPRVTAIVRSAVTMMRVRLGRGIVRSAARVSDRSGVTMTRVRVGMGSVPSSVTMMRVRRVTGIVRSGVMAKARAVRLGMGSVPSVARVSDRSGVTMMRVRGVMGIVRSGVTTMRVPRVTGIVRSGAMASLAPSAGATAARPATAGPAPAHLGVSVVRTRVRRARLRIVVSAGRRSPRR